jgi:type III secretion protein J
MISFRLTTFAILSVFLVAACQVDIQHELTEKDANEIIGLLAKNGITATKVKEEGGNVVTWAINVSSSSAADSIMVLNKNSLPRPKTPGLEIFNKGSMIPTATEERAMFLQAISGELSRTLSSIDDVLDARVHINIPQNDELSDQAPREPSSAVFIKYRTRLSEEGKSVGFSVPIDQIQRLVARSVQDLKQENVHVVLVASAPDVKQPSPESSTPVAAHMPELVEVLGIRMEPGSVSLFRIFLAITVTIVVVLTSSVGYLLWRKSRSALNIEES